MLRKIAVIASVGLVGCHAPMPIADFKSEEDFKKYSEIKFLYGDVTTFSGVMEAIVAYSALYHEKETNLKVAKQSNEEVTFYSAITALVGAAVKSSETFVGGSVIGAGSAIYSERYKIQIQSLNYGVAVESLECMRLASLELIYRDQSGLLDSYVYENKTTPRRVALDGLAHVKRKLESLQSDMVLGSPDLTRLQTAFNRGPEKTLLLGSMNDEGVRVAVNVSNDLVELYPAEIDKCRALMGK